MKHVQEDVKMVPRRLVVWVALLLVNRFTAASTQVRRGHGGGGEREKSADVVAHIYMT